MINFSFDILITSIKIFSYSISSERVENIILYTCLKKESFSIKLLFPKINFVFPNRY